MCTLRVYYSFVEFIIKQLAINRFCDSSGGLKTSSRSNHNNFKTTVTVFTRFKPHDKHQLSIKKELSKSEHPVKSNEV